jgi:hypothetical protein
LAAFVFAGTAEAAEESMTTKRDCPYGKIHVLGPCDLCVAQIQKAEAKRERKKKRPQGWKP